MTVVLSQPACAHGHAERGGDGVGGVSACEGIVFTFIGRGERADALVLAVGGELLFASGEYLVAVGLVADVPHQAVVGCVVDIMQCHGQFHNTQAGGEMSGIARDFVDDVLSQFTAHLR